SCKYMKMDPPPDVDKAGGGGTDNSCWMATASNMLAGAGYGTGTDVQARADEIYSEMVSNYGIANGGWADVALSWWLSSANNTWSATNPYTIVTVYGNKTRVPWVDADGAQFIGNELRRCQFLGLSISWPTSGSSGSGGHAITAWGDNMGSGTLSTNPVSVMVTDSDRDTGGDVQTWDYDDYTNPNPAGSNNGNGWYFDYSTNHPFIKHIITLCPTDDPSDNELTQKVVGSYRIHQSVEDVAATDLHYRVRTDVDILSYKTTIDWTDKVSPTITEGIPRRSITVDWDLKEHAIEYCTWVTITTEFVLPRYNAIFYDDVHFTYPATYDPTIHELHKKPDLYWWLKTPVLMRADQIPNVTGGYVVASFDVINPVLSGNQQLVGEYRLIHQYSYDQDPEMHEFLLAGTEGYSVENLRFGHTYGYPSTMELWKFEDWMTVVEDTSYFLGEEPLNIQVDWEGKLPYPEGEVIPPEILKEIREQK
ncbi:MAG: hypothetical protein KAH26_09370, partial [Bacteroidales bacterium]|nr:hypothetical protein [Bacteroidales bacterium]